MATMTGFAFHTFSPSKAGGCGLMPGIRIEVNVSAGIDARGGVEPVTLAGVEVVNAVGGRGVDGAGACVGRDVGRQHAENRPIEKRMLESDAVERRRP